MTSLIAWKSGMALSQQHLQKSDRLFLQHIKSVAGLPNGLHFGFRKIAFDDDLLKSGSVAFRECEVIFPNGIFYADCEYDDVKIESRNYENIFEKDLNILDVFLTLELSGASDKIIWENYADVYSGDDFVQMPISVPIPKIIFSGESLDGKEFLHCARIVRNGRGIAELDRSFFPPLISVSAYTPFFRELEFLENLLKNKIADMSHSKEFLLNELKSFGAVFSVLKNTEGILPFQIFCEISRLLQEPFNYNHFEFGKCFGKIFMELRNFLSKERRDAFSQMRLLRDGQSSFYGSLTALDIKNAKSVYLVIDCNLLAEDAVKSVPMQIKVAPRSELSNIVISATHGISCVQTIPPEGARGNEKMIYFKLNGGSLWQKLCEENEIGIYAPSSLKINSIDILTGNL
ncbi:hypothetical protein AGMMS49938_10540 [Fibrobacterales bacterium]|nr:hypothetical protein AGMMS49938_10540 [Fibrobacterales bacterium]